MNTRTLQRNPETFAAPVPGLVPARVLEIELGQPLPVLLALDGSTGRYYQRALCLVQLHSQPLGVVELQFDQAAMSGHEYGSLIWSTLSTKINEHLLRDGSAPIQGLDAAGLSSPSTPRCIEERERFKHHAPFVSVIVPTHNRPEQLQACLRSLLALDYPRYECIIVDNAPSTSATRDLVEQEACRDMPQVAYVREDRPGVSWARNCGMMVARGEILAFTDDDVVVDRSWLIELVRGFSRADNVACVTGYNLPLELETPAQFWYEEYGGARWFQENGGTRWGFTRRIFDLKEHHPKTPLYPYRAGMFGCGASMAFTAVFLRSVHGFDPALGGNGPARCSQDIAVFFQVITRGHTLVYEPASLVHHLHRRTYFELRKQIYNYGIGLTAYLTKSLLENPRLLIDLIAKLMYSACHPQRSAGSRSTRSSKSTLYPKELIRVKHKGMLYGPLAYLQSRRMMQKVRKAGASVAKLHDPGCGEGKVTP
jgi:glycosyltransferase involved in cell wall biosynthesis